MAEQARRQARATQNMPTFAGGGADAYKQQWQPDAEGQPVRTGTGPEIGEQLRMGMHANPRWSFPRRLPTPTPLGGPEMQQTHLPSTDPAPADTPLFSDPVAAEAARAQFTMQDGQPVRVPGARPLDETLPRARYRNPIREPTAWENYVAHANPWSTDKPPAVGEGAEANPWSTGTSPATDHWFSDAQLRTGQRRGQQLAVAAGIPAAMMLTGGRVNPAILGTPVTTGGLFAAGMPYSMWQGAQMAADSTEQTQIARDQAATGMYAQGQQQSSPYLMDPMHARNTLARNDRTRPLVNFMDAFTQETGRPPNPMELMNEAYAQGYSPEEIAPALRSDRTAGSQFARGHHETWQRTDPAALTAGYMQSPGTVAGWDEAKLENYLTDATKRWTDMEHPDPAFAAQRQFRVVRDNAVAQAADRYMSEGGMDQTDALAQAQTDFQQASQAIDATTPEELADAFQRAEAGDPTRWHMSNVAHEYANVSGEDPSSPGFIEGLLAWFDSLEGLDRMAVMIGVPLAMAGVAGMMMGGGAPAAMAGLLGAGAAVGGGMGMFQELSGGGEAGEAGEAGGQEQYSDPSQQVNTGGMPQASGWQRSLVGNIPGVPEGVTEGWDMLDTQLSALDPASETYGPAVNQLYQKAQEQVAARVPQMAQGIVWSMIPTLRNLQSEYQRVNQPA